MNSRARISPLFSCVDCSGRPTFPKHSLSDCPQTAKRPTNKDKTPSLKQGETLPQAIGLPTHQYKSLLIPVIPCRWFMLQWRVSAVSKSKPKTHAASPYGPDADNEAPLAAPHKARYSFVIIKVKFKVIPGTQPARPVHIVEGLRTVVTIGILKQAIYSCSFIRHYRLPRSSDGPLEQLGWRHGAVSCERAGELQSCNCRYQL